jgi:NADPH:quinone reductase-like Zn-dependent oxidoreductase
MRAIVLEKFGGLDSLVYRDIPEPEPKAGHVVIQIKAFGINHAEMHIGWLGGLDPMHDFNPLLQMASGVYLSFFGSFVFGTPGFPLSDVPLQRIAEDAAAGRLDVEPARIFGFDEIREAHRVMETGEAGGKMVVVLD